MPRSRRRSSVLRLNQSPQGFRAPRLGGRPSSVGAPQNRPTGEDMGGALAPQFSTIGGNESVLTPNVEAFAPQGGPAAFGGGEGESTALIDALIGGEPGSPGEQPGPIQLPNGQTATPAPQFGEDLYTVPVGEPGMGSFLYDASYQPAAMPTVAEPSPLIDALYGYRRPNRAVGY